MWAHILYLISNFVGITGVTLLLIGFYLINTGKIAATSMVYQMLNLLGATFILFSLFFDWNLSAAVIEVCWIIISLIGIYRACRTNAKTKS